MMRVECTLEAIMEGLEVTPQELGSLLHFDHRNIINLLDVSYKPCSIKRTYLHRLMLWANEHGYPNIFEIKPVPVWRYFANRETVIYREDPWWDTEVDTYLRPYLTQLGSRPTLKILGQRKLSQADAVATVEEDMKSRNCVFLGSPKKSLGTEIAMSLLWDVPPFESVSSNMKNLPIWFGGMHPEHEFMQSSMIFPKLDHGIYFKSARVDFDHVPVDYLGLSDYMKTKKKIRDAALVVSCHKPLGTAADVTTIIVAGFTGRATSVAMEEMISGYPPLPEEGSDQPFRSILKLNTRRTGFKGRHPKPGAMRKVEEDSLKWVILD